MPGGGVPTTSAIDDTHGQTPTPMMSSNYQFNVNSGELIVGATEQELADIEPRKMVDSEKIQHSPNFLNKISFVDMHQKASL